MGAKHRWFWMACGALCIVASRGARPSGVAVAETASGQIICRVTAEGQPIAGALVSDGCRVARTDPAGKCLLAVGPDSGPFVCVTNPAGFWTDEFSLPVAKAIAAGRHEITARVRWPDGTVVTERGEFLVAEARR